MLIHKNTCHQIARYYSCSIDSILELIYHSDRNLKLSTCDASQLGEFTALLKTYCERRTHCSGTYLLARLREPIWNYLVQKEAESFAPKGTIYGKIDRFACHLILSELDKNIFALKRTFYCETCNFELQDEVCPLECFGTMNLPNFSACLTKAIYSKDKMCETCEVALKVKDVQFGDYLAVNLGVGFAAAKNWTVPTALTFENIDLKLLGLIRNIGAHFISIVKLDEKIVALFNDMLDQPTLTETFEDCLKKHFTGHLMKEVGFLLFKVDQNAASLPSTSAHPEADRKKAHNKKAKERQKARKKAEKSSSEGDSDHSSLPIDPPIQPKKSRSNKRPLSKAEKNARYKETHAEEIREKDRIRKQKKRQSDPEYRHDENASKKTYIAQKRSDPEYRQDENVSKKTYIAEKRSDPEYRKHENASNKTYIAQKRRDPEYRQDENASKKTYIVEKRSDLDYRQKEADLGYKNKNKQKAARKRKTESDTNPKPKKQRFPSAKTVDKKFEKSKALYYEDINIHFDKSCSKCGCLISEDERVTLPENPDIILDRQCAKYIEKGEECPFDKKFMQVAPQPKELQDLTFVERRLIAQVHPFIAIVVLPGGQYGENGQIINFPTDLNDMMSGLPCSAQNVDNLIFVESYRNIENKKKTNTTSPHNYARLDKVLDALQWLREHNHLYANEPQVTEAIDMLHFRIHGFEPTSDDEVNELDENDFNETAAMPTGSIMPNIDIRERLTGVKSKDKIPVYKLGRNKNRPISVCDQTLPFEEKSAPWLFPDGKNGLNATRTIKLTELQYYKCRLLNETRIFAKDMTYLLSALAIYHQRQLHKTISIALRMRKQQTKDGPLTVKDLTGDISPDIVEDSYRFMKHFRGLAPYWRSELRKLLSRCYFLGVPTFFLTLSAADCSDLWPELFESICDPTSRDPIKDRWKLLRENPTLVAKHFVKRWKALFKHIIKGPSQPLGEVENLYIRVEFQDRGSAHIHALVWTKHAPNLDTIEGRKLAPAFIDKYISTMEPSTIDDPELKELVQRLQTHAHNDYCMKGNKRCRFEFPRPLTKETKIKTSEADDITQTRFYETKRLTEKDRMINAYNPTILKIWKANMDIQLVASIYGLVNYICSYITKAEPEGLKHSMDKALERLPDKHTARDKYSKIGNVLFSHRKMSAQEASWILLGLPLVDSTCEVPFVNARLPIYRDRMIKPLAQREGMPSTSTNVIVPGIFDHYPARPATKEFDNMNLSDFVTKYTLIDISKKNSKTVDIIPEYHKAIQNRNKQCCLGFPRLSPDKHEDEYYYAQLLLFKPWRDESKLLDNFASAKECFKNKDVYNALTHTDMIKYKSFADNFESALINVRELEAQKDGLAGYTIAPNTVANQLKKQNRMQAPNDYEGMEPDDDMIKAAQRQFGSKFASIADDDIDPDETSISYLTARTMTDEKYLENMAKATDEQLGILKHFNEYYDSNDDKKKSPIRLHVGGGAGAGKSFTISLLAEHLIRKLDKRCVLLSSYTGVAAQLIGGLTLHTTLRIPVDHRKSSKAMTTLEASELDRLQKLYADIELLIIDEVSMVSLDILTKVHLRMNEIFGCSADPNAYFGNKHIAVLGDFHQIKPVFGSFLFVGIKETNIFQQLFTHSFLTKNMRQQGDQTWLEILKNMRLAQMTEKDFETVESRLEVDLSKEPFISAIRLFPTNDQCNDHNAKRLDEMHDKTGNPKVLIKARNWSPRSNDEEFLKQFLPKTDTHTNGIPNELTLMVGAPIMLLRNICQTKGMCNGSRGVVHSFAHNPDGTVDSVNVLFDDPNVGQVLNNITEAEKQPVAIKKTTIFFLGTHNIEIFRHQFPLKLCFASTYHKIQGANLDAAVIDAGPKVFQSQMTYVAFSRVRELKNIALTGFCRKSIYIDQKVVEFYKSIDAPWKDQYKETKKETEETAPFMDDYIETDDPDNASDSEATNSSSETETEASSSDTD